MARQARLGARSRWRRSIEALGMVVVAALSSTGRADAGATPGGLVLTADEIELVDGWIEGRGAVIAQLGDEQLRCASFRYDPDGGTLIVEDGRWMRRTGVASFEEARIDVRARSGEVQGGEIIARRGVDGGAVRIEGRSLSWAEDGRLEGADLRVTTCGCAHPLWEIRVREAVVIPERSLRFRGGLVSVLGVPLLPVPAGRLPLAERQSGLSAPRLGGGQDGLLVGLPAYLSLGPAADLTVEPELRTDRGARLLVEGRWAQVGGGGHLRVAGGQDWRSGGPRGAVALSEGLASGPWRVGVDAALESDRTYLEDYGDAFLSRSMPWDETLAVVGWGPLRVEHDGFQALGSASAQGQRPAALVASLPGRRMGPVSVTVDSRVDLLAEGSDPWALDASPRARSQTDLAAVAGRRLGVARVEGRAAGSLIAWSDAPAWATAGVEAGAWIPAWTETGAGRLVGEWGLLGGVGEVLGDVERRLQAEEPPPSWALGPAVTGRLLTAAGVPLSGAASVRWTSDGWDPRGWVRADGGRWALRASVDRDLQELRLSFDDGRLKLSAAGVHGAAAFQQRLSAAWTLPGALSPWRPGYFALLDLDGGRALSHGPRLSFASRCGCLSLAAALTWAIDREVPDIGLQVQVP